MRQECFCKNSFLINSNRINLTFATPWGSYCCTRLFFGLASAPKVYQEMMSSLLDGIENVDCSMDDILIYGKTLDKLNEITSIVLGKNPKSRTGSK